MNEAQNFKNPKLLNSKTLKLVEYVQSINNLKIIENGQLSLHNMEINLRSYYNLHDSVFSMESQNPEFKNYPGNFHQSKHKNVLFYQSEVGYIQLL